MDDQEEEKKGEETKEEENKEEEKVEEEKPKARPNFSIVIKRNPVILPSEQVKEEEQKPLTSD